MSYGQVLTDKITTSDGVSSAGLYGFKNRIINGDMRIDQRNAGASVTPTTGTYTLDRWTGNNSISSKYTVQQNAASVTPPVGFANYLGVTSSSAYSVLTGDYFLVSQSIEGLNTTDLAWGTASAATVTLSFWVRSSLTGTFGGAIRNAAANRSYPFTYTISSANTWEQKSVTIAGDTSGTWLTTNAIGVLLSFSLGAGATFSGTAGAWAAGNIVTATGATSVVGTNGATFYITGVQLEKGSTATSFDYRPYGTELQLAQRYFEKIGGDAAGDLTFCTNAQSGQGTISSLRMVPKRAAATITVVGSWTLIGATGPTVSGTPGTSTFAMIALSTVSGGTNVAQSSTSAYLTASAEL